MKTDTNRNPLRKASSLALHEALRLARLGFPTFPLGPRSKVPIKNPSLGLSRGFKDATTDPERLTTWFRTYPNANLAIAAPPGTLVLDLDIPEALDPLLSMYPSLTAAPRAQTGSGGWHLWLRAPKDIVATARIIPELGLDLRSGGRSYLVAPPSIHPKTGNPWRWVHPLTVPPAALPPIPLGLLRRLNQARTNAPIIEKDFEPPSRRPPPEDEWLRVRERKYALKELESRRKEMEGTPTGQRHNALMRHAVALTGWYRAGALEADEILNTLVPAAQKAGLPQFEAANTVRWALKRSAIAPRTLKET